MADVTIRYARRASRVETIGDAVPLPKVFDTILDRIFARMGRPSSAYSFRDSTLALLNPDGKTVLDLAPDNTIWVVPAHRSAE